MSILKFPGHERLKLRIAAKKIEKAAAEQQQRENKEKKRRYDIEQAIISISLKQQVFKDVEISNKRYTAPDGIDYLGIEICRGTYNGMPAVLAIDKVQESLNVVIKYGTKDNMTTQMWRVRELDKLNNFLQPIFSHTKLPFKTFLVPELIGNLNARQILRPYR